MEKRIDLTVDWTYSIGRDVGLAPVPPLQRIDFQARAFRHGHFHLHILQYVTAVRNQLIMLEKP
jgi:hypothetical protein